MAAPCVRNIADASFPRVALRRHWCSAGPRIRMFKRALFQKPKTEVRVLQPEKMKGRPRSLDRTGKALPKMPINRPSSYRRCVPVRPMRNDDHMSTFSTRISPGLHCHRPSGGPSSHFSVDSVAGGVDDPSSRNTMDDAHSAAWDQTKQAMEARASADPAHGNRHTLEYLLRYWGPRHPQGTLGTDCTNLTRTDTPSAQNFTRTRLFDT